MLTFQLEKKVFHFVLPAGTSRGVLKHKLSWYVKVYCSKTSSFGLGECSVIEGLSPDYVSQDDYENRISFISYACSKFEIDDLIWQFQNGFKDLTIEYFLQDNPSIRFGFEIALFDLFNGGNRIYFENDFVKGKSKIPINGLIWMGDEKFMKSQIIDKLKNDFTTLKMKVGAIDFNAELNLINFIRNESTSNSITIRVDANGAFQESDVNDKLKFLTDLDIHSIEQPIKPGNWKLMKKLCEQNLVPIALDEELINVNSRENKMALLTEIKPAYIILKPSLHGGIRGTKEWILLAEELGISWWITSALESNVGLSALCQFVATFDIHLPQGLGTGSLFTNNSESNLHVEKGYIMNRV
jgi:O-succinylbenzoate synthase